MTPVWNRSLETLRQAALAAALLIFAGGLFYSYTVSQRNSAELASIGTTVYPLVEESGRLKVELDRVNESLSQAVLVGDEARVSQADRLAQAFLELLAQIEAKADDKGPIGQIRQRFEKYQREGLFISRYLIKSNGDVAQIQEEVRRFSEDGRALAEAVDRLYAFARAALEQRLERSRQNSALMLRIGLSSAVGGIALLGIVSGIIIGLNRRLRRANEHLEGQVHARTQELEAFVYSASHDLKSPLVAMQGMASLFMQDYGARVDEKGQYYLKRIIANANYMEDLIQGLLELSRIGRETGAQKTVAVGTVLNEIVATQREALAAKGIEVAIAPDLPRFEHNQIRLRQVFQNLISNAAKFMGDQPKPRIEVGGRELERTVEFFVRDNGIGIDPAYHDKIFSIFQRLKEVEVEGTGVGLAIVKKIIDVAGGRIWIESEKGKGTTFFVHFPKSQPI